MIFQLITTLCIGLVVGLIARFLLPGRDPMGCLTTSLLGIAGSFVGGFLSRLFFDAPGPALRMHPSFLVSLVGAILVLIVFRFFRRSS